MIALQATACVRNLRPKTNVEHWKFWIINLNIYNLVGEPQILPSKGKVLIFGLQLYRTAAAD
jgi:hypothetical protein